MCYMALFSGDFAVLWVVTAYIYFYAIDYDI